MMDTILAWTAPAAALAALAGLWRKGGGQNRRNGHRLWNDLAHELTADSSLDAMLLHLAGVFRRDVDADCAYVYKISLRRRQVRRLGVAGVDAAALTAPAPEHTGLMAELAWWASQSEPLALVHGAGDTPLVTLPLRDGDHVYGILLVQNPRRPAPSDWIAAAALVARHLSQWCEVIEHGDRGILAARLADAMPQLLPARRLEAAPSVIDQALKGIIAYDYLSISSLGDSRAHEDRVSMLADSQRVTESRHGWPVTGAALRRVLDTGRAVITPDLDMADDEGNDDDTQPWPWERRLGMRSRLIVPVRDGRRVTGTLTLAHRQPGQFDETAVGLLETVAAHLAPWFCLLNETRRRQRQEQLLAFLGHAGSDAADDDASLINAAAGMVDATGIRVYRLDDRMQSLSEVGASGRIADPDRPRQVPLAQLPWHRWALESRRTLTVNQGDPEAVMDDSEAALAMDRRMKTGCLVPIHRNGMPLGVIDVIERRHPDRAHLDAGSRMVLGKLADALCRKWSLDRGESGAATPADALSERLKAWSREVVNPLTTIIGSAELIRLKQADVSPEVSRYLGSIERSATRIHTTLMEILQEAAIRAGDEGALIPRERWSWTRPAESAPASETDFVRPASLADAARRHATAAAGRKAPVGAL
ncbi:MAG TPA: GAF domain-containing protein [bacterium]|nr:GAF domain-containing protein [bacterium]